MTYILGLSAFFHDSAACLVKDGEIIAAAQEERFSRVKHDSAFPQKAVDYCLSEAGITPGQLDYVTFYEKPLLHFERLLESYLAFAPRGLDSFREALPVWASKKLFMPREIDQALHDKYSGPLLFTKHHESHAASAFFPSPYDSAAIITVDGVGEWTTLSIGVGKGNEIRLLKEIKYPHSLGLLYSAFTYYLGFRINNDEYKVMGLAPYGKPVYRDLILQKLVRVQDDGSLWLDQSYFNYSTGLTMTNKRFDKLFGGPARKSDQAIGQREMDLAASVQAVTTEVMLKIAAHAHEITGEKNLCLAGGVALNCVANGEILRKGPFESVWVQPAAGDAGGALGAALFTWHQYLGNSRRASANDSQKGSYLGPAYSSSEVTKVLGSIGATYDSFESEESLCKHVAELLDQGKIVGHFHGRMEFGPRALGARSIIGDARNPKMQSLINQAVKFRESFRPFAPIVMREHASKYFDIEQESPYMLMVAPVKDSQRLPLADSERNLQGLDRLKLKLSTIPAVTHVDYSARIQTVTADRNPRLYELLSAFYARTGTPVLINTSFNVSDEPIVCTPLEAYQCFLRSKIDYLVLENCVLERVQQKPVERRTGWECMQENIKLEKRVVNA